MQFYNFLIFEIYNFKIKYFSNFREYIFIILRPRAEESSGREYPINVNPHAEGANVGCCTYSLDTTNKRWIDVLKTCLARTKAANKKIRTPQ